MQMTYDEMFRQITEWQETLKDTDLEGTIDHLVDEAFEVYDVFFNEHDLESREKETERLAEELADTVFLVLQAAKQADIDLLSALQKKLLLNQSREWVTNDGKAEHA